MMFPDGCPILIASEASLENLNEQYEEEELVMDRFRPNIVLSGCEPYAEVRMLVNASYGHTLYLKREIWHSSRPYNYLNLHILSMYKLSRTETFADFADFFWSPRSAKVYVRKIFQNGSFAKISVHEKFQNRSISANFLWPCKKNCF